MPLIDNEYYDNISSYWAQQGVNNALRKQEDRRQAECEKDTFYCDCCGREIFKQSDVFGDDDTCLCQWCAEALEEI